MKFARWETLENMKELTPLLKVNGHEKIKSSGLPFAYDDGYLYVNGRANHTLVIGTTGSGKTQCVTLPMLNQAWLAGESVIVSDSSYELYETTKDDFKKNGYKIYKINLDEATETNNWNPFDLIKKLYEEKNYDKALDELDLLGYYLINGPEEQNSDPFWINSAVNYFSGICLYLLENKEKLNIDSIYEIDNIIKENPEKFLKSLNKKTTSYINLSCVLLAPTDTKMSIITVFDNKYKLFIAKENLKNMLSKSDFDITKLSEEKTVVFIKAGKSKISANLLPLFIEQVYADKSDKNRLNIIVDEFYSANPILDFPKMLSYSREVGILFTVMVRGFNDLKKTYGVEGAEMVKLGFSNIVYLLSQDIATLEEISKLCGETDKKQPLVTIEDLKCMRPFEAIILTIRMMPFKTKMLPYFEFKNA